MAEDTNLPIWSCGSGMAPSFMPRSEKARTRVAEYARKCAPGLLTILAESLTDEAIEHGETSQAEFTKLQELFGPARSSDFRFAEDYTTWKISMDNRTPTNAFFNTIDECLTNRLSDDDIFNGWVAQSNEAPTPKAFSEEPFELIQDRCIRQRAEKAQQSQFQGYDAAGAVWQSNQPNTNCIHTAYQAHYQQCPGPRQPTAAAGAPSDMQYRSPLVPLMQNQQDQYNRASSTQQRAGPYNTDYRPSFVRGRGRGHGG